MAAWRESCGATSPPPLKLRRDKCDELWRLNMGGAGFAGEPAAPDERKPKICDYAGLTRSSSRVLMLGLHGNEAHLLLLQATLGLIDEVDL